MIKSKEWSTGFFLFDIGLFQGCVLSTILFDCVFQLLLDFLKPTDNRIGYNFKKTPEVKVMAKAYADDLTLIANNISDCQLLCNQTNNWPLWIVTMMAKPAKCVSMTMKRFEIHIKTENCKPIQNSVYSLFDPGLTINNQPIRFILNANEKDEFKSKHFKFLGRWISAYLNEKDIKAKIKESILNEMEIVDKSLVNGIMKLWIYQFYVLYHFSWPLLIHDLDKSFISSVQSLINPYLKKWAGIYRSVDNGVLFRSRSNFGLGLTCISDHYKSMQLIKCELLENSIDPSVRKLYLSRASQNSKLKRVWRATNVSSVINAEVSLNLKFPTQSSTQGIGFGNFNPNPSAAEKRKLVTVKAKHFKESERINHSLTLSTQGIWLKWSETALPFDLSWKNLIWGNVSRSLLKFVLNASVNWLITPNLLKLWGLSTSAACPLCNAEKCTMHHILSNCAFALEGQRYTWRHDSVLLHIESFLKNHIQRINKQPVKKKPAFNICFVKPGNLSIQRSNRNLQSNLLDGTNDWQLLVDFMHAQIVFPPEIFCTNERPDIIIWSNCLRKVILVELTCPADENIYEARVRKETKYLPLLTEIRRTTKWEVHLSTIEVGVRGCVGLSLKQCLSKLGLPKNEIIQLCKAVSFVAASCSHTIFNAASARSWPKDRVLLKTNYLLAEKLSES